MADLNALLSPLGSSYYSAATAINASGQVFGYAQTASGLTHPFLYSNGKMTDLNRLYGFADSHLAGGGGINNAGQIVGQSGAYAFLFINGKMTDLNSLIPKDS